MLRNGASAAAQDQGSRRARFRALVQIPQRRLRPATPRPWKHSGCPIPTGRARTSCARRRRRRCSSPMPALTEVKAFFSTTQPHTGAGKAALAGVYMKENNETAARELVISAWRDHQLNVAVEKKILDRYGSMLTTPSITRRASTGCSIPTKRERPKSALRVAKLLPAAEQKKVAARIAVIKRGGNAGKLLDALPANAVRSRCRLALQSHPVAASYQGQGPQGRSLEDAARRAERAQRAARPRTIGGTERRINCRGALNYGQPRVAYEIAAKHGPMLGRRLYRGGVSRRLDRASLPRPIRNNALRHFRRCGTPPPARRASRLANIGSAAPRSRSATMARP